ncbi:MAG: lysophospholipid acyltransferase family protein [Bacillota bacterium]
MTHLARKSLNLLFPLWVWLVAAALVLPAALLVIALPGQKRRRRLARWAGISAFWLCGTPLRVKGLAHLPASCIVVANHASYLDGVILTAALPPRFSFVIKREITRAPVVGWLLKRLGSEFVERFDKHAARNDASRLIQRARDGACLGMFPEGTFKREEGLRPFHLGAFIAATRAGLPVAPVVIRGARTIMPAGSWWPRHGRIHVEVLTPVSSDGRRGDHARELRDKVRERILSHCGEPDMAHHHGHHG